MGKSKKQKYIEYDYENTYKNKLENENETLLNFNDVIDSKNKNVYAIKEIDSGVIREIEIYPEFKKTEIPGTVKRKNIEAQRNLNDKNARKNLTRLINTNFNTDDIWLTLTYTDEKVPTSMEQALKNIQNYMRRINYRRKKLGLSKAKYIYITEHAEGKKGTRCHHHIVMDGQLGMDEVEKIWKLGKRNEVRRLDYDEYGLTGLANYLTKDPKGNKRWCSSTNLKQPEIRKNHYKFKKRQIRNMVRNQNIIKAEMEKTYQNYIFTDAEVRFNDFNGMYYIYTRMRKKANSDMGVRRQ